MTFQYILYVSLAPVAILVTGGVLLYAWRHRITERISTLVWLMTVILGWLIFNTFELISPTESGTLFWAETSYIFIAITPVAWLAFALQYTGRTRWLSPIRLWMLSIIPVLTTALAVTNKYHHLLWADYTFVRVNQLLAMHVVHGPWFWVYAVFGYVMVFLGAAIISQQYFKPFEIYRQQSVWLLVGALAPVLSNLIYIFHLIPGLQKDFTPLSFAIAGIAFAVDVNQYQLFDLRPVARDLVIDSTTDAMITLDAQDRVVDLNPAAVELQVAGMQLKLGDSIEKLFEIENLLYLSTGETTFQQDISLMLHDSQHYFDLRSMPIKDRREYLVGRLFILRDITDRKGVEMALRQQTAELEIRNRELDAFAHTVAHDLKGPMGTTVGYATMLRSIYKDLPEEELIESLDGIVTSTYRMSEIVDALLLLAQVRKLEDVPCDAMDIGTVVVRALERLHGLIKESGAKIIFPPNWPFAMGYAPWVEAVWVNYISNAVKYGGHPEKGVKPIVQLGWDSKIPDAKDGSQPDSENGHCLRLWVRDNGELLTREARESLFVEFTRLDHTASEGHGLGLSIVKRILDKQGGKVGVDSVPGEGNVFYFTLPACEFD